MSQRSLGSVHDTAARRRTFYIAEQSDRREPVSIRRDRGPSAQAPHLTCVDAPRQLPGAAISDRPTSQASQEVLFGPFRLLPTERRLLEGETPVRLGSRALDILAVLVQRPGELVSKQELVTTVWPDTFVDEGNLKVHIAGLRRALADGLTGNRYIATIAGRGYCFVAPVKRTAGFGPTTPLIAAEASHNLPVPLTRLIGRDDILAKLQAQLVDQRLTTVVGVGGVGKTSLALAAVRGLIARYEHGVWFVDLTTISDPSLAPMALASAIGIELPCGDPIPRLISHLRDKRMLLVLDNCEHVIEGAAAMALQLLKGAPSVQIVATGREPLRIESERVHRLSPLECPAAASVPLSASASLEYPAVQLFLDRATSALASFELPAVDVPLVIDICRKLDGIPLAIEGAASAVEAIGIRGVAAHLDKPLRLPATYRRMTPSRHRSLRATLDWSYRLLSETEQIAFRRLGVFSGRFSLEAAAFMAADAEHPASEMVDEVAALVTKSLVTADLEETEPRFRLLKTIRAYALEKLGESGEGAAMMRHHAERRQCPMKLAA